VTRRPRLLAAALLPFALHAFARELDGAVGTLLHTSLDLPGFVAEALQLLSAASVARRVALWSAAGAGIWLALAAERSRREGLGLAAALEREAATFRPLYLRALITGLALVSLALRPTLPYGFTLPVALTQDWSVAQDAAAASALLASRLPAVRLPAPRAGAVFFIALLAYAHLAPGWARVWDGHPGNEPKTLRMAVAIGHELTLDAEGVTGPMESLTPAPTGRALAGAARALLAESAAMMRALARGPSAVGASAITATRITRQTVAGRRGGVYYVLAPGPSVLLAPLLRADRALNLARGTPGRLTLTLLAWNALAAGLVAVVFLLTRDATGRPGLSAAAAGIFGLVPPFVFYSYQFYPEVPGALLLALALRLLLLRRRWSFPAAAGLGAVLACLPWLHQKFLPLWAVLVAVAGIQAVSRMVPLRSLLALALPQAVTLYLTALYNFAITGSVRPDALYLAWGPRGVAPDRVGQGLLGLLLDARYGLLPNVPLYLLAAAGAFALGAGARRLRPGLALAAVYYATVASADNWSGAVSNLGRYVLPVAPLGVALAAAAVGPVTRRGVAAAALALASWTAVLTRLLWFDPHAASDSALLFARSVFADPNLYVPNLFLGSWGDAAPGLAVRLLVWTGFVTGLAFWLRRVYRGRGGRDPLHALAGVAAVVLAAALLLERWPPDREAPRFRNAVTLGPGVLLFAGGAVEVRGDRAVARAGDLEILVRAGAPVEALSVVAAGEGLLHLPTGRAVPIRPRGTRAVIRLPVLRDLTGRRGVREVLQRQRVRIESEADVLLRFRLRSTVPGDGAGGGAEVGGPEARAPVRGGRGGGGVDG
jgi:hypothetical protein